MPIKHNIFTAICLTFAVTNEEQPQSSPRRSPPARVTRATGLGGFDASGAVGTLEQLDTVLCQNTQNQKGRMKKLIANAAFTLTFTLTSAVALAQLPPPTGAPPPK